MTRKKISLPHRLRLAYAEAALDCASEEMADEQDRIIDLMTNLLHYAESKGISLDDVLRLSRDHFVAEQKEEAAIHASPTRR